MNPKIVTTIVENCGEFGGAIVIAALIIFAILRNSKKLPARLQHKNHIYVIGIVLLIICAGAALWAKGKTSASLGNTCDASGNTVSSQGDGSSASVCNQGDITTTDSSSGKNAAPKPEPMAGR